MSVYVTCDEELVTEKVRSRGQCGPASHGTVKEVSLKSSTELDEEKKLSQGDVLEINSIGSSDTDSSSRACQPDGACRCKSTVRDEARTVHVYTCAHHSDTQQPFVDQKLDPTAEETFRPDSMLRVLSGRPYSCSIIQKVLEEAEGESAVVVCGPMGLKDDVRNVVVALSDERAVHKGTGAQDIYLHVERFDY